MSGRQLWCAGGAALALASGCSVLLDFSEKPDASNTVSLEACQASEPNDSLGAAKELAPGSHQIGICPPGDRDFFSLEVAADQDMSVVIEFANLDGAGDLEMRLYNLSGDVIEESGGFVDIERIERTAMMGNQLTAGTYIVEVFGDKPTIQNSYTMMIAVGAPPTPDAGPIDAGMIDATPML